MATPIFRQSVYLDATGDGVPERINLAGLVDAVSRQAATLSSESPVLVLDGIGSVQLEFGQHAIIEVQSTDADGNVVTQQVEVVQGQENLEPASTSSEPADTADQEAQEVEPWYTASVAIGSSEINDATASTSSFAENDTLVTDDGNAGNGELANTIPTGSISGEETSGTGQEDF